MSDKARQCKICGKMIWLPGDYIWHTRTSSHQRAVETRIRMEKNQVEAASKQLHDALELASALEGHSLKPGDEITTREDRSFKVDINGTLFEVPLGSVG